jgi:hypothetical protein
MCSWFGTVHCVVIDVQGWGALVRGLVFKDNLDINL